MRWRGAVAGLLIALASAAPAAADGNVDEARARFQRGVELFHEGSFDAALAEFSKAYQIAPAYRLLYNIAQAQYELHDHVAALKSFRQYLRDGGDDVAADRRAQVEAEIRSLQGLVGFVEIHANVEGADVLVDDVAVGISPLDMPVLLNAGIRRVTARKAGRTAPVRNVTVAGGDHLKVDLVLPEPPLRAQASPGEPAPRDHTRVWIGAAVTIALAAGAAGFALATRQATNSFDAQLDTFPNTKDRIDQARTRMVTLAAITDGLAGAALVAGGITIYLGASGGRAERRADARPALSVAVGPDRVTLGGRF